MPMKRCGSVPEYAGYCRREWRSPLSVKSHACAAHGDRLVFFVAAWLTILSSEMRLRRRREQIVHTGLERKTAGCKLLIWCAGTRTCDLLQAMSDCVKKIQAA
jgi:hypothetical protein